MIKGYICSDHLVGFHYTFICFDLSYSSSFLGFRRGVCSVRSLGLSFDSFSIVFFFSFCVFNPAFGFDLLFYLILDWFLLLDWFFVFSLPYSMMIFLDFVKEGVILFSSRADLQASITKINSSATMVNKLWTIPMK